MSRELSSAGMVRHALLAELRCASLRAKLVQLDVDAVGIAVKSGLISVEQAIGTLGARGALSYLALDKGDTE